MYASCLDRNTFCLCNNSVHLQSESDNELVTLIIYRDLHVTVQRIIIQTTFISYMGTILCIPNSCSDNFPITSPKIHFVLRYDRNHRINSYVGVRNFYKLGSFISYVGVFIFIEHVYLAPGHFVTKCQFNMFYRKNDNSYVGDKKNLIRS
jgi:hypothetical protein